MQRKDRCENMASSVDIERVKYIRKHIDKALDTARSAPHLLSPAELRSLEDISKRLDAYTRGTTPMKHFSC